MSAPSLFARTEALPADPNIGLTEAFRVDKRPHKINLSVGTYADELGRVPLLHVVNLVESRLAAAALPRDYQPIDGLPTFNHQIRDLLFAVDGEVTAKGAIATVQTLGGTGALRVGADYLCSLYPDSTVYVSNPTWTNHRQIFCQSGLRVADYPYYNADTASVDFERLLGFLQKETPAHSIIVLHVCCHNPTGADLSESQWRQLGEVVRDRNLIAFFDMAYQGLAAGPQEDAFALRLFSSLGLQFLVATSFSKSFSLYGERVGALCAVASSEAEATRILSNLKRIVRTSYSNPPTHGAMLVSTILAEASLRAQWERELGAMRLRITAMRQALIEALSIRDCPLNVTSMARQRGMFSYTGLRVGQVRRLKEEHSIYALESGRICVAALNPGNVSRVADAITAILKTT